MDFNDIKDIVKFIKSNKIKEFYYKKGDEELSFKLSEDAHKYSRETKNRNLEKESLNSQITGAEQSELAASMQNRFREAVAVSQDIGARINPGGQLEVAPQDSYQSRKENLKEIVSPFVGSFYRSSAPDKPPFVEAGSVVEKNSPVCIIEAMKIMNEIEVDMKCRIVSILVENGELVEYNQPLFLVEPL